MNFKPKNILITGGLGFIGTNFIEYFLKKYSDINIINIDKHTYAANKKYTTNLSNYEYKKGDICDKKLITSILKNKQIDTIINFAAESHVDNSITNALDFINTNIIGTYTLLDSARAVWDLKSENYENKYRFHHISTDEVFGSLEQNDQKFTEANKYFPNSPYSASKASSDHLVRAWHETFKIPITISNCSNNYGPYQHSEKFIPTIIDSCKNQTSIPIYGDGKNIRDWLHVQDHCEAIDLILRNSKIGKTYNIGGNCEMNNLEIVSNICDFFNKNIRIHENYENLIKFVEDRKGHDFRYAIDCSEIKQDLGWSPKINFETGIIDTIKWYL